MTDPTNSKISRRSRGQRGFTLVELLVGVVIAMAGVVIMMQVLLDSDARNRTTSGGSEAMSNGAVMLHLLQRDLMQAGYGLNALNLLGCTLTLGTGASIPLAPLAINPPTALVPAGDANTDRLLIVYGNDNGQPEGNAVLAIDGNDYTMQASDAFAVGDRVVAVPDLCTGAVTLAQVTAINGGKVTVDAAVADATTLYNLGRAPRVAAYAVRNGSLTSCDFLQSDCRVNNATAWVAVSGNIVSLRAVYGRDTTAPMDGTVETYDQTTPTTSCEWARVPAARVAVVARSSQYESRIDPATGLRACEPVTSTAPVWLSSGTAPVVLSGSDWQCYRYRAFENVAPLRNVIWMGAQPSC